MLSVIITCHRQPDITIKSVAAVDVLKGLHTALKLHIYSVIDSQCYSLHMM